VKADGPEENQALFILQRKFCLKIFRGQSSVSNCRILSDCQNCMVFFVSHILLQTHTLDVRVLGHSGFQGFVRVPLDRT
jgi:hypothetical protein